MRYNQIVPVNFRDITIEQAQSFDLLWSQAKYWEVQAEMGLNKLNFVPAAVAEQAMVEYMKWTELKEYNVHDKVRFAPTDRSGSPLYAMAPAKVQILRLFSDKIKSLSEKYPDVAG